MEIIRCTRSHDADWNAYVARCPRASFYHRAEWRTINEQCFGHTSAHLAAIRDGRIVGVFPIVRLDSLLFGNIACSMPFVNFGGPAGDDDTIEAALLAEGARVAEQWDVGYVEIRSQRYLGDGLPSSDHKVSMTVALDPDPEVYLGRLKREQRKEIRRALKHGYVTRTGPGLLADFYHVLSQSWRDLGTPIYAIDYLQAVVAAFPDHTRITVVYTSDGRPAAAAMDGMHGSTMEGMWLGIDAEFRKELVGYVLYWELIKGACERGFTRYHLGRSSKHSNNEVFKSKWNAESMQLYWHYILRDRAELPGLNPNNPKYQMAMRAWRRLPLAMTQTVGPLLARNIP